MQYLESKPCQVAIAATETNKPYHVQSLHQLVHLRPTTNKILHNLQLRFITSLESAGVVENITIVLWENNLVLNVVQATLRVGSSRSAIADTRNSLPNLHRRFELDLAKQ